jgi:Cdc6-like AAA superfamily ATPase
MLEAAAAALRPGAPKGGLLPCRAAERRKISTHLRSAVEQGGSSKVLYVSGMPGTGKTAIVLEVVEQLRSKCQFFLVHVNAMRLGDPAQVFGEIADQMLVDTSIAKAAGNLTDMFRNRQKTDPVIVLLIDEVDCLATRSQGVLYQVFDWLGLPNARLVLTAISNTMDLPERLLPRVASRFHIERMDFQPYTRDQLYEILCSRLKGRNAVESFKDIALRLCAAKIAAGSGDIRKALQVCRRAVEIRLQTASSEGPVAIEDLTAAEKELILANPSAQAVMALSAQARRFLTAVVVELRSKDADVVAFPRAVSRFQKILSATAVGTAGGVASTFEVHESALMQMQRCEALTILRKEAQPVSTTDPDSGAPLLSLGSLDLDDLTQSLLKIEDDATVRELLDIGRSSAEITKAPAPLTDTAGKPEPK